MYNRVIISLILMIVAIQSVFILVLFNKSEKTERSNTPAGNYVSEFPPKSTGQVVANLPSDKSVGSLAEPKWDCSLYQCGDSNKNVYPASEKIIEQISGLKGRMFGQNAQEKKVDLIIAYDVTCSNCMWLKDHVIKPLLSEGYRMFLFPTTYREIDSLTSSQLATFKNFICNPDTELSIDSIHSSFESENCSLDEIKNYLSISKNALAPFGLQHGTPIIFTKSAIVIGGKELEVIRKYL